MLGWYLLLSKLRQCAHSLDAIKRHDEALQLPHVFDSQSKTGLVDLDVIHLVILDFSEKCVLIREEVLYELLGRTSHISVRKNLNKVFHLNSLVEIAGSSQVFVLCSAR